MNLIQSEGMDINFYKNKRVLVTGHTGFKGTWLCKLLVAAGAQVTGYALEAPELSLYAMSNVKDKIKSIIGDIRNLEHLRQVFIEVQPEIVFHLAAQPIVRDSYDRPVYTYETNVMGTVNILECVRVTDSVKSFLNVTTDKVYENKEWCWGYRENDGLDGYDPYSNSKSCSELVTHCYKQSFFADGRVAISTARAGNVIGGGDFAMHRIIPDCIRAMESKKKIIVRNPDSIRPYQHVLEPLYAYLMIAQKQYDDYSYCGCYNVGPDDRDCVTTGTLVEMFCNLWGKDAEWEVVRDKNAVHESNFLKLDCSRLKNTFNWCPRWNIEDAVKNTIEWFKEYLSNASIDVVMEKQIEDFYQNRKIGRK